MLAHSHHCLKQLPFLTRRYHTQSAQMDPILKGKYPAKAHAAKVAHYLKTKHGVEKGTIYLEGQKTRMQEDNDEPVPFRSIIHR